MEGNDIAPTLTSSVAVMFEGLIRIEEPAAQKKWYQRSRKEDLTKDHIIRKWRPLELPLKSLLHMVNQLHQNVEVYTYFPSEYVDDIETWLFRKGVSVTVISYDDLEALKDDFKYNRDVHTLYTPFHEDVPWLGPRAYVMAPDRTWGF